MPVDNQLGVDFHDLVAERPRTALFLSERRVVAVAQRWAVRHNYVTRGNYFVLLAQFRFVQIEGPIEEPLLPRQTVDTEAATVYHFIHQQVAVIFQVAWQPLCSNPIVVAPRHYNFATVLLTPVGEPVTVVGTNPVPLVGHDMVAYRAYVARYQQQVAWRYLWQDSV